MIALLFLICIGAPLLHGSKISEVVMSHDRLFRKVPLFSYIAAENLTRSYAVWPHKPEPTKNVTVGLETYDFDGELIHNRTCGMRLDTGNRSVNIDDQYLLMPLGRTKAALLWKAGNYSKMRYETIRNPLIELKPIYSETMLMVRIMDLENCKYHDTSFTIDEPVNTRGIILRDVNVVPCEDGSTFEIFFRNRRLCKQRRCRAMYDSNANLIAPPEPFLDLDFNLSTEEMHKMDSSGAYVVLASNDYQAKSWILLVSSKGEVLVNHSFAKQAVNRLGEFKKLASSHEHDYLGFCEQAWRVNRLTCQQFDAYGNLKLNFSIEDLADKMGLLRVMNLPEGGFALIVGKKLSDGYGNVKLWKVEPTGDTIEVPTKELYYCNNEDGRLVEIELFEKTPNSICLSYACFVKERFPYGVDESEEKDLKVTNECFH